MTPPRDGGPPGDEQLVARVIPLRRRGEAGDSELLTAPPPATAPGPRDEPGEPTSAVADRDMWEDRASQLRVRKPAVTGGLRSPHEVAAPDAGQTLSGRRVSRTRLGIAALVAVLVAAGAFAVASSDPHVVARAAHVGDSKSAPAAAKASAAKGVAARAAAARTALRAARKRAAATAARERASRVARAHALAVSRARAARAKQRAQRLAREQASEAPPAPTVVPAAPVAMQPVVANSPAVVTHPRSSAPRRSASSAGGCATAVPGQLGC
jgi:ABC-2 type transport system ATP-binding protein